VKNDSATNSAQPKNISDRPTDKGEKEVHIEKTTTSNSSVTQKEPPTKAQKPQKKRVDPLKKVMIGSTIGLIALISLLIYSSKLNTEKYYLRGSEGALEVWKGTFSPAGKKRLVIMPGVKPPGLIKPEYSREEVYPLICVYYIDKSDALVHVPGMPDFIGIKMYLNRALTYATTEKHSQSAMIRLHRIDRMTLFYKADVAASKGSVTDLETALGFIDEAAKLNPDEIEAELIEKKKHAIRELLKNMKVE